jgi:hypothetical protein
MGTEKSKLPDQIWVLFENGLVLGTFLKRDAAERMQDARTKAGKPIPVIVPYKSLWS